MTAILTGAVHVTMLRFLWPLSSGIVVGFLDITIKSCAMKDLKLSDLWTVW